MTGLIVLGFVPLLAAIMFGLRAIRERNARLAAERELEAFRTHAGQQDQVRLRFLGIVAHELRSPLGAIIGYQELMAEGLYGTLDDRALEGLHRIGNAARQLLTLTDGMEELASEKNVDPEGAADVDIAAIARSALADAQREADGRNVRIDAELPDAVAPIRSHHERARNLIDLLLFAAIKLAADGSLRVTLEQDQASTRFTIAGVGLELPSDPDRPSLPPALIDSGPALRLAIASRLIHTIGGSLNTHTTDDGGELELLLPPPASARSPQAPGGVP